MLLSNSLEMAYKVFVHYAPTPTHIVLIGCDAYCTPKINGIDIAVCVSLLHLFAPRVAHW